MDAEVTSPIVRTADLSGPDGSAVSRLVEAYLVQTEREKGVHLRDRSSPERLGGRYRSEVDDPAAAYADATVYLAIVDDRAAGVAVVKHGAEVHEIKRVWVDPGARGRRVGSALIDATLTHRDLPVRLTVWDWRDDAIRLYRSRGFVAVPSWDERPRLLCLERPASSSPLPGDPEGRTRIPA